MARAVRAVPAQLEGAESCDPQRCRRWLSQESETDTSRITGGYVNADSHFFGNPTFGQSHSHKAILAGAEIDDAYRPTE
jgi:hypothetical protein